jgi:hypothetical protein
MTVDLKRDDIDGVICVRDVRQYEYFCYKVGIKQPRLVNGLESSGRMSGLALQYAAMAINAGIVKNCYIIYANNSRTGKS